MGIESKYFSPPEKLFTEDYFNEQVARFWEMCGDRQFTLEQLAGARYGLFYVYLNTEGDIERMASRLLAADENHLRRQMIRELSPPPWERKDLNAK